MINIFLKCGIPADQINRYDGYFLKNPFWHTIQERTFEKWGKKYPSPDDEIILDIGCGTGRCFINLTQKKYRVVGVDLSYSMLCTVENKAANNDCLLILCSATKLPLTASSIISVVCFGALHHISSPQKAIHEIYRVMKKGMKLQALQTNASPLRIIFDILMKLKPLWEEEAGDDNILSSKKILKWSKSLQMEYAFNYSVYIPPHIFLSIKNRKIIRSLIMLTDLIRYVPFLKTFSGILYIECQKK